MQCIINVIFHVWIITHNNHVFAKHAGWAIKGWYTILFTLCGTFGSGNGHTKSVLLVRIVVLQSRNLESARQSQAHITCDCACASLGFCYKFSGSHRGYPRKGLTILCWLTMSGSLLSLLPTKRLPPGVSVMAKA